jgi:zinc D-Ala-D-Ala carboxypeptidase
MTLKIWKKAIAFGQPAKSTTELANDIPEALRETPNSKSPEWVRPALLLTGGLGLGAIAVLSSVLLVAQVSQQTVTSAPLDPDYQPGADSAESAASSPPIVLPERTVIFSQQGASSASPSSSPAATGTTVDNVLGHLPYEAAPASELQSISADGQIRLRKAAAQKYNEMIAAARANGIILAPISGFRTVEEQNYLFFEVKAQRNQVASKRAEVSAPPGYSEHHTGYAIDIGDANVPSTNLQIAFENTAAYQWLERNAARYGFELSFPRNNPQGVSYEPWHWRFVGNIHSLETFYRAHNLPEANPKSPIQNPKSK